MLIRYAFPYLSLTYYPPRQLIDQINGQKGFLCSLPHFSTPLFPHQKTHTWQLHYFGKPHTWQLQDFGKPAPGSCRTLKTPRKRYCTLTMSEIYLFIY